MKTRPIRCSGIILGLVIASRAIGCSPTTGSSTGDGLLGVGTGGGGGATGGGAGRGAGASGPGTVFPDSGVFHPLKTGTDASDGSCSAISQSPETITVYKDATVTDTITTYSPVALYIMQDRSGSMREQTPTKWSAAVNGVTAFVNDPRSAGLDVGLAVFEPATGGPGICDGSDCGQPVVPIASLPNNASAIVSGINSVRPSGNTPTECALRGAVNHCLVYMSNSPIGEQCVVVLITDGQPTSCNTDPTYLTNIVTDAHNKGVLLFALGMNGANFTFLDQLAQAGGTTKSYDVTLEANFEAALDTIRNKVVTVTSTQQVTRQQVIATELPCQWKIPPQPAGKQFDPTLVNVQLTSGGSTTKYGNVGNPANCSRATDGWYYDNPSDPTQISVCPQTCDKLTKSTDARVDILFGCTTIPVTYH